MSELPLRELDTDDQETTAYRGLYCPGCADLLSFDGWCPRCEPDLPDGANELEGK